MTDLRIGDPVQVHETSEVLILVAIDGEHGWCRDDAGGHATHRLEDLVLAASTGIMAQYYRLKEFIES